MKKADNLNEVQDFDKYRKTGAYHWNEMKPSIKTSFNPYLHARYELALQEISKNGVGLTAVDLGCGDGYMLGRLLGLGYNVIGLDGSPDGIEFAKKELSNIKSAGTRRVEVGNVYATGLPDSSADLVVTLDVIEHLEKPDQFLQEINRVAKNNATILIGTPLRFTEKPLDKFHTHEFFAEEFVAALGKFFDVKDLKKSHPIEMVALLQKKFNVLGRKKNLGWNLINFYYFVTGKNLLMNTKANFPTYQLAVCTCRKKQ